MYDKMNGKAKRRKLRQGLRKEWTNIVMWGNSLSISL